MTMAPSNLICIGHLFCAECLDDDLLNDDLDRLAPCLACNMPFPIGIYLICCKCCLYFVEVLEHGFDFPVDPDPRSIPAHLHPFIKPSIRHVYLPITGPENPPLGTESSDKCLRRTH